MKKIILISALSLFGAAAFSQVAKTAPSTAQQKSGGKPAPAPVSDTTHQATDSTQDTVFILHGTVAGFQALMQALDASTAPHTTVEALKQWISADINKQLQAKQAGKK